ncbi:hypothetical protein CBL_07639 [Carabus blaptoides fortunei]
MIIIVLRDKARYINWGLLWGTRYFDKLDGPYFKAPVKQQTKDSIMMKCVAQTLIENPANLDPTKLAKCFVKEYFTDPRRGYSEACYGTDWDNR